MSFDLFSQPPLPFSGDRLKELGMAMAEESANNKVEGWSDMAFELLKRYLKINKEPFMTEFFRQWTEDKLPEPPSKRAFGAVISRASREGLIKHCGYAPTTNYKAHKTPASVWVRV